MFAVFSRNWWLLVLRGIAAVIFGVLAFVWPGITLFTLVLLFGAYAFMDGIFLIVHSISGRKEKEDWWMLLIGGIMGVIIGVITFLTPGVTTIVLLIYIAAWALAMGVLEVIAAIRLRKVLTHEILLVLSGIASIVFAFLLMLFPASGALGLVWLIGIYAIVLGIALTVLGFEVHHFGKKVGVS